MIKILFLAKKIRQTEGSRRTISSSLFSLYLYDAQRHTERRFLKSTIASGIDSVKSSNILCSVWLKNDYLGLISQSFFYQKLDYTLADLLLNILTL